MHGFINGPALAKLVALQVVDEELQRKTRRRKGRVSLRARLGARRTSTSTAPAAGRRMPATGKLAEER